MKEKKLWGLLISLFIVSAIVSVSGCTSGEPPKTITETKTMTKTKTITTTETKEVTKTETYTKTLTKTETKTITYTPTETYTETYGEPVKIKEFYMLNDDNYWEIHLRFIDEQEQEVPASGTLKIEIQDEYGFSIYKTTISITKSDFTYLELFDEVYYKRTIWKDEVKKKGFSSRGIAYVEFISDSGTVLKAQDSIYGIPEMSDEEKEAYFEQKYLQNSKECENCIVTKGNFRIQIIRYGWYEALDWDEIKKYFRVDFKITNVGSEVDYIFEDDAYLIDIANDNKQYGASWDSKLENSEILPRSTEEGYLLFEGLPEKPSRKVKFVWMVDDWPEDIYYEFYVYIP
ncbi:MAG: Uncharacterized protein XD43_0052 [Thermococcales archaeon 44_46]|nr:MAG: Uncharacterized protein XD43_0052 [Thermococcales archaeon 44_46]HIH73390.1 hypothetical protein [Thermococcaceae archaeon]